VKRRLGRLCVVPPAGLRSARRVRALRLTGLLVVLLAPALGAGCGSGEHPPPGRRPAAELVVLRRLQPVTMLSQSATVLTDGSGFTSNFVGERSIVERPVRLPSAALARLRRQVGAMPRRLPRPHGRPPRTAMIYTVHVGGRALVGVGGRLPRRLAPVVRADHTR
jgi:hypothetical protein